MEYDGCLMDGDEILEVLFTIKDPRVDYNFIPEIVSSFFVGENVEIHFKRKGERFKVLCVWDLPRLSYTLAKNFWSEDARDDRVYRIHRITYKHRHVWRLRKIGFRNRIFPNPFALKNIRELDIQLDRRPALRAYKYPARYHAYL